MNAILALDREVFLFVNHLPHTPFLDLLFMLISGVGAGGLIWFMASVYFFAREEKKDPWFFLPTVIAGIGGFFATEVMLKHIFDRARPTAEIGAIVVAGAESTYAFPSGHATVAWAMAAVLAKREPSMKWVFYILAALISFSRIYLGKHYPLDVIAGAVLGWAIGRFALWFESFVIASKKNRRAVKTRRN